MTACAAIQGPWLALDAEDAALKERGFFGCVGMEDPSTNSPFRYHGKVQFSGKLSKSSSESLRLNLEKPELGSSSRFTRRFGSDWLIRIRYQKNILPRKLLAFFMRPLIIFDRVYRAFYARLVHSVHLPDVDCE